MVSASEHSEPVGTLPQRVRRDFSGVGYGEESTISYTQICSSEYRR